MRGLSIVESKVVDFRTISKGFVVNQPDMTVLQEIFMMLTEICRRLRIELKSEELELLKNEANDMLEVIRKDFNHVSISRIKDVCIEISQGKYDQDKDYGFRFFRSEMTNSLIKGLYRSELRQNSLDNKKYFLLESQSNSLRSSEEILSEEEKQKENAQKQFAKYKETSGFVMTQLLYDFMKTKAKFRYSDVKYLIGQFRRRKKYYEYKSEVKYKELDKPKVAFIYPDGRELMTRFEEQPSKTVEVFKKDDMRYDVKRELVRLWFEFLVNNV